jgi:hypothetical protein
MVAIIGRHTAVESEAIAARQKERPKPRGTYKPRALSDDKIEHRTGTADGVYRWLEGVLGDEFVDQTTDHRHQLKEAEGGDQNSAPRLGVVGLKCRDESLPMSQWFAKKGGDGGHNHILLF